MRIGIVQVEEMPWLVIGDKWLNLDYVSVVDLAAGSAGESVSVVIDAEPSVSYVWSGREAQAIRGYFDERAEIWGEADVDEPGEPGEE